MALSLQIPVEPSLLITGDAVRGKIRKWNTAIGATSSTPLPRNEKQRRVVAILDRHVDKVQLGDGLPNQVLDFALLSFLTHIGFFTEVSEPMADALYDPSLFDVQPRSGDLSMLTDFCHYVYHELELDPSVFIYKYRTAKPA